MRIFSLVRICVTLIVTLIVVGHDSVVHYCILLQVLLQV